MPRSENNKQKAGKPTPRKLVQSLEIPSQICLKPPSRITICSPCASSHSQQESPESENVSAATSYTELFCTTQTCTDSENCINTCQPVCSHGLKELKNEGSQCSETCSNNIAPNTKPTSIGCRNTPRKDEDGSRSASNYPASVPIQVIKSTSFSDNISTCCKKPSCGQPVKTRAASNPTKNDKSGKQSEISTTHGSKTKLSCGPCGAKTQDEEDLQDEEAMQDEEQYGNAITSGRKMSCCADSEKNMKARNASHTRQYDDNELIPLTPSCTNTKELKAARKSSRAGNRPEPFAENDESDIAPSSCPVEGMNCCSSPKTNTSIIDNSRKSSCRTSFQLPEAEPKPLGKSGPVPVNASKADLRDTDTKDLTHPCQGAGTLAPPQKCSCHFPPAFNQFGCTGNISGNCNCANDD